MNADVAGGLCALGSAGIALVRPCPPVRGLDDATFAAEHLDQDLFPGDLGGPKVPVTNVMVVALPLGGLGSDTRTSRSADGAGLGVGGLGSGGAVTVIATGGASARFPSVATATTRYSKRPTSVAAKDALGSLTVLTTVSPWWISQWSTTGPSVGAKSQLMDTSPAPMVALTLVGAASAPPRGRTTSQAVTPGPG